MVFRACRRRAQARADGGEDSCWASRCCSGRAADGSVFALRDICPHRGIPLQLRPLRRAARSSAAITAGASIRRGAAPPSRRSPRPSDLDIGRIRVKAYPAREVQGNVWVFFGDRARARRPTIPVARRLRRRAAPDLYESVRMPCAIDHAVIGLMDPAHGAVRPSRLVVALARLDPREGKSVRARASCGFTMVRHAPSRNSNAYRILGGAPETEIAFRLPGVRIEDMRVGRHRLVNLTAVTPLGAGRERGQSRDLLDPAVARPGVKPLLRPFVRAFLGQDRDIMTRQQARVALTADAHAASATPISRRGGTTGSRTNISARRARAAPSSIRSRTACCAGGVEPGGPGSGRGTAATQPGLDLADDAAAEDQDADDEDHALDHRHPRAELRPGSSPSPR